LSCTVLRERPSVYLQACRFIPSDLQEAQGGHYERLKMIGNHADTVSTTNTSIALFVISACYGTITRCGKSKTAVVPGYDVETC